MSLTCLQCRCTLSTQDTYDINDAGRGSIKCRRCGKVHDINLLGEARVSEPMSVGGKAVFWLLLLLGLLIVGSAVNFIRSLIG